MHDPSDISANKAKLREKLRFRRRSFAENLDSWAALTAFHILPDPLETLLTDGAPIIGAYAATKGEPNILPLLTEPLDQRRIAMPFHAARDEHMEFYFWQSGDPLEPGPWRTPQPLADNRAAEPQIILCPMLGFDRQGGRLGQGGGHYDRYFEKYPNALRIGIAWSIQEIDATPLEKTDIYLDAVLTEQEYIICGTRL